VDESLLARLRGRRGARTEAPADQRFQRLVPSGLSSTMMPWAARDFLISSALAKSFLFLASFLEFQFDLLVGRAAYANFREISVELPSL
jgi:hypothetical protein